jgi:hypothetical protein
VVSTGAVHEEVVATLVRERVTEWVRTDNVPPDWAPDGSIDAAAFVKLAADPTASRLACLERAYLALAETGSLVIAGPPEQRQLGMLSDLHILAVREFDIVPDLVDAAVQIEAMTPSPAYLSFVTGPSRSSDIERTLAIGVHGPSVLHVIVVTE